MEGVAQLDIEVGMCEQDTRIDEVVLRAAQRLGFADLRPQQMEAIKTFMQGKDVFVSLPTGYDKSLIYSVLPLRVRRSCVAVEEAYVPSTATSSLLDHRVYYQNPSHLKPRMYACRCRLECTIQSGVSLLCIYRW